MKQGFRYFVGVVPLLLLAVSCVRDVVMDAGEDPQVVVECVLSDEPVQTLYLSYTKGASRAVAPDLPEAEAVLTDLTEGKEAGRFARAADGNWTLDYAAIPAHRYRLDISVPGHEPIWAEQTMPEISVEGEAAMSIALSDYKDEYFLVWEDFFPTYETVFHVSRLPDHVWVYALNYNPQTGQRELAEEICTDFPGVDNFNLTGAVYDPPMRDDVYNPFLPGYDSHIAKLYPMLEGKSLHRHYLRLPKKPDQPKEYFIISGSFTGKYCCLGGTEAGVAYYEDNGRVLNPADDEGFLVFVAVSADYDRYLQEAIQQQSLQESSELPSIYVRDNSFSNISGGLGILGAKVEQRHQWCGEYSYIDIYNAKPLT